MEELIKNGDTVEYLIDFESQDFDTDARFKVYEVCSWTIEGAYLDTELYLSGVIKWDGCSHIWYGDGDGYLHLCGKKYFDDHNKVMDAIWDVCSKRIKRWNNDVATK